MALPRSWEAESYSCCFNKRIPCSSKSEGDSVDGCSTSFSSGCDSVVLGMDDIFWGWLSTEFAGELKEARGLRSERLEEVKWRTKVR